MLVFGGHVGNTARANVVASKPSTAQGNHTGRLGHRDAPQRTCPLERSGEKWVAVQPFLLVWTYVSASSDAVSSPLLPETKAASWKASKTELDLVLNAGRARSL